MAHRDRHTRPFSLRADGDAFVSALLAWFADAMRPLPWRKTYDPYSVWISEIMLQQTQMERGVSYFNKWLRRFPDIGSVARAGEEDILAAWEGLGYYSRARNLHAAAKRIMLEHGGVFPRTFEEIRSLPGIGEYTAGAIAAIAFNQPRPAVDANVMRIFARLCDIDAPPAAREVRSFIDETVRSLMPADSPRLFNQALMELGALVCGKKPDCGRCPVAACCQTRRNGTVAGCPVKTAKGKYRALELVAGVVVREGRLFVRKRPAGGLWGDLWEFPGGPPEPGETPEKAIVRLAGGAIGVPVAVNERIATVRHGYTIWRVTLHGYLCVPADGRTPPENGEVESAWMTPEEAAGRAFPAGHRKLLEHLGWKESGSPGGGT